MSEHSTDVKNHDQSAEKPTKAVWATLGAGVLLSSMRWFHFAHLNPVGALSFFGGARLRTWHAYLLPIIILFVTNTGLWMLRGYNHDYSPLSVHSLINYAIFPIYVLMGRLVLNSRSIIRITITLFIATAIFVVASNFSAWLVHSAAHARDLAGLVNCFQMALPFAIPTLIADVGFGALLFGIYAVASRVESRTSAAETQPVTH